MKRTSHFSLISVLSVVKNPSPTSPTSLSLIPTPMPLKTLRRCCFALLSLLGSQCFAQTFVPGYVHLPEGDTVRGSIVQTIPGLQIVFREHPDSAAVQLSPNNISGFGIEGTGHFVTSSITIADQEVEVFLERIATGRMNAYWFNGRAYIDTGSGLEELTNPVINGVETRNYIVVLEGIMGDCRAATSYLRGSRTSRTPWKSILASAASIYNECDQARVPKVAVGLSARIGLHPTMSSFSAPSDPVVAFFNKRKLYNEQPLAAFVDVEVRFRRISIVVGGWYVANSFSTASQDGTEYNTFELKSKAILVPVQIGYVLYRSGPLSASVRAGTGFTAPLSFSGNRIMEVESSSVIYRTDSEVVRFTPGGMFTFSADVAWKLKPCALVLNVGYTSVSGTLNMSGMPEVEMKTGGAMVSFGIRF